MEAGTGRAQQAILACDPSKPGLYVVMVKWLPGGMSRPHFHPNDRFITVLKGTLGWPGTKFDPNNTVPMPAASFVTHFGSSVTTMAPRMKDRIAAHREGPATSTPRKRIAGHRTENRNATLNTLCHLPRFDALDFTGPLQVLSRVPQSATHIAAKSKRRAQRLRGRLVPTPLLRTGRPST